MFDTNVYLALLEELALQILNIFSANINNVKQIFLTPVTSMEILFYANGYLRQSIIRKIIHICICN